MKQTRKFLFSTVLWSLAISFTQQLPAAPVVFTIDSSQSQISASGVVLGATFTAQGAGALTTSYNGSINAEVSGATIQFTDGSAINAQNSGSWQPNEDSIPGTAPANYGPKATISFIPVYAALRNIVLDLTSPELDIVGGDFSGTNVVFSSTSPTAVLDYYSAFTSGSIALTGYATNAVATQATLITSSGTQTLTIPIDAIFYYTLLTANDTTVHLTGKIVATSPVATPPIIHSLTINNQNVVVAVENATAQSQLLVSTNLLNWSPASAVISTNNLDWILFTTPLNGPREFFRVEQ